MSITYKRLLVLGWLKSIIEIRFPFSLPALDNFSIPLTAMRNTILDKPRSSRWRLSYISMLCRKEKAADLLVFFMWGAVVPRTLKATGYTEVGAGIKAH